MKWTVLLLCAAAVACAAATPPSVRVSETWPETPAADYAEVHDRWTRHAEFSADWRVVIDAWATLESPELRSAQVAERARRSLLPADEAAVLTAKERADAAEVWQVELLVQTAKPNWNDLADARRTLWRLALVAEDGREVLPLSIKEDKRPREAIESWYRRMTPFHRAYILRFPRLAADGQPLVREGAKLTLKVASTLAALELTWGG